MKDNKDFQVGEQILWLCPMYESIMLISSEVVKLFKNGKVRIKYRNTHGDVLYGNKDRQCLQKKS